MAMWCYVRFRRPLLNADDDDNVGDGNDEGHQWMYCWLVPTCCCFRRVPVINTSRLGGCVFSSSTVLAALLLPHSQWRYGEIIKKGKFPGKHQPLVPMHMTPVTATTMTTGMMWYKIIFFTWVNGKKRIELEQKCQTGFGGRFFVCVTPGFTFFSIYIFSSGNYTALCRICRSFFTPGLLSLLVWGKCARFTTGHVGICEKRGEMSASLNFQFKSEDMV